MAMLSSSIQYTAIPKRKIYSERVRVGHVSGFIWTTIHYAPRHAPEWCVDVHIKTCNYTNRALTRHALSIPAVCFTL